MGNRLVGLVADCWPASLEGEPCPARLQHVSKRSGNATTATYLFRVELPSLAERCPLGSPQSQGEGHNQAQL